MDAERVTDWVGVWGPLITLLSTVVLSVITAWLAYLTKVMADSARTSTDHARLAAEASLSAVDAAEASIDVRFKLAPVFGSKVGSVVKALQELEEGGMSADEEVTPELLAKVTAWQEVRLICSGATVTVHGLKLTDVSMQDKTRSATNMRFLVSKRYDEILLPSEALPRVCHGGEEVSFVVPDRPAAEDLTDIRATVLYSIGNGPIREREARWTKSPRPSEARD